ncbi:hypothetical protein NBRC110019_17050 [Neptunitalea chrysea]|uniref:Uncharacterized protein n=1 Tax=Neptunitalea chrysea TaxID=1647581 RepID=A0A9W6B6V8_9FLAO|nr:hypothetical protein [Neptunitalea chrysea]GLB52665.1 hypothetical protein NBRC110019_17050 [Neptunitalea chrysea]
MKRNRVVLLVFLFFLGYLAFSQRSIANSDSNVYWEEGNGRFSGANSISKVSVRVGKGLQECFSSSNEVNYDAIICKEANYVVSSSVYAEEKHCKYHEKFNVDELHQSFAVFNAVRVLKL